MKIYREESYEALSRRAGNFIAAQIIDKPEFVLGLATGSSPVGTYKRLIELNKEGDVDFAKVTTVNLDEYVGLAPEHDQSYRYFMNDNLFNHVNIDKKNTYVPNGMAEDIAKECADYDKFIESIGGIDLQLLGIGFNGHIGFNEPADIFDLNTRRIELTESTMQANSRFFPNGGMPTSALSMGFGAIFNAKKILIIAGEEKYDILKAALTGPVDPKVPASILQFHKDVTVIYVGKEDIL